VVEKDGLELAGPPHDRLELRLGAVPTLPQFDPDHRPVGHAALELVQAFGKMRRIQVDETTCPVAPGLQQLEDLVVGPGQDRPGRMVAPRRAQVEADAPAVHPPDFSLDSRSAGGQ